MRKEDIKSLRGKQNKALSLKHKVLSDSIFKKKLFSEKLN